MCGGTVVLEENGSVAVCEYCGTRKAISQPEKPAVDTINKTHKEEKNNSQADAFYIENERRKTEEANARAQQARLEAEAQRLERERLSGKKRLERKERSKILKKKILTIFLAIVAISALGFLTVTVIIPSVKYNSAVKAVEAKNYEEAYITFKSLYKFKDSQVKAEAIIKEHPEVAQIGDIIYLGAYEQDNNFSNGKEEIEWKVLDKDANGKMLIVSRYAIDCGNYHSSPKQITWEDSDIRKWLNNDFIATAFSSKEKSYLQTSTIDNSGNPDYKINESIQSRHLQ